jgi:hypothetical protein
LFEVFGGWGRIQAVSGHEGIVARKVFDAVIWGAE